MDDLLHFDSGQQTSQGDASDLLRGHHVMLFSRSPSNGCVNSAQITEIDRICIFYSGFPGFPRMFVWGVDQNVTLKPMSITKY